MEDVADHGRLLTREEQLAELLRAGEEALAAARATIAQLDAQLAVTRHQLAQGEAGEQPTARA